MFVSSTSKNSITAEFFFRRRMASPRSRGSLGFFNPNLSNGLMYSDEYTLNSSSVSPFK